ncbi:MAG: hypothetical protein U1E27_00245 [Kiritimatiellia bacterium]|nr:hypothetical protein [Kiritimatiellia bacterium]
MFSTKAIGVLAIFSAVLLGAVIALQVLEYNGYRAEPSVWSVSR